MEERVDHQQVSERGVGHQPRQVVFIRAQREQSQEHKPLEVREGAELVPRLRPQLATPPVATGRTVGPPAVKEGTLSLSKLRAPRPREG